VVPKDLIIDVILAVSTVWVSYKLGQRAMRQILTELAELQTLLEERLPLPEPVRVLLAPLRVEAHLGKTVIRRDSQGKVISEEHR
jgi:hypothetical protein